MRALSFDRTSDSTALGPGVKVRTVRTSSGETFRMETVDVHQVDAARRNALRDQLLEIQLRGFRAPGHPSHMDRDTQARVEDYIDGCLNTDRHDAFNTVAVIFSGARAVCDFHAYMGRRRIAGKAVRIVGGNVTTVPSFRGRGLTRYAVNAVFARFILRHLLSRHATYVAPICMSPVSYSLLHRIWPRAYPSPTVEPSTEVLRIYDEVFPGVRAQGGLLRERAASRVDDSTRAFIEASDDPFIRFFMERNPRFEEGFVLPMVLPFGVRDAFHGSRFLLARSLRQALRTSLGIHRQGSKPAARR
ncbi:MAG: hypothetical protein OXR73_22305 [Myxococcales bacterium]|nr:hypothetical protein [Myxococcales bacterium]